MGAPSSVGNPNRSGVAAAVAAAVALVPALSATAADHFYSILKAVNNKIMKIDQNIFFVAKPVGIVMEI